MENRMLERLSTLVPLIACLALILGCQPGDGRDSPSCPNTTDSDGDGLTDCEELELGLDPENEDTDDDGFTDADELECVSDPLDENEYCYACGWEHNDPGTYESQGNSIGDTAANSVLVDQCGDEVDLWDFTGKYYLIYLTAAW